MEDNSKKSDAQLWGDRQYRELSQGLLNAYKTEGADTFSPWQEIKHKLATVAIDPLTYQHDISVVDDRAKWFDKEKAAALKAYAASLKKQQP